MKPFDLEAAKAGAKVVDSQGNPVEILTFHRGKEYMGSYPIVALLKGGALKTFGAFGESLKMALATKYVNLYCTGPGGRYYDSLEQAKSAVANVSEYIKTIEVEI